MTRLISLSPSHSMMSCSGDFLIIVVMMEGNDYDDDDRYRDNDTIKQHLNQALLLTTLLVVSIGRTLTNDAVLGTLTIEHRNR